MTAAAFIYFILKQYITLGQGKRKCAAGIEHPRGFTYNYLNRKEEKNMTKAERNEIISAILYAYKAAGYDFSERENMPTFCCDTCEFFEPSSGRCCFRNADRDTTGRNFDKDGFMICDPNDLCWDYVFDENACREDD